MVQNSFCQATGWSTFSINLEVSIICCYLALKTQNIPQLVGALEQCEIKDCEHPYTAVGICRRTLLYYFHGICVWKWSIPLSPAEIIIFNGDNENNPLDLWKVDVYSYGICLYELITRRIPYDTSGLGVPEDGEAWDFNGFHEFGWKNGMFSQWTIPDGEGFLAKQLVLPWCYPGVAGVKVIGYLPYSSTIVPLSCWFCWFLWA